MKWFQMGLDGREKRILFKGKTDIITKAPDNSSIFIAECKVWRGEKVFMEAIDQLLGYVTWRDTRTAIILFVKKGEISDVIEKAR